MVHCNNSALSLVNTCCGKWSNYFTKTTQLLFTDEEEISDKYLKVSILKLALVGIDSNEHMIGRHEKQRPIRCTCGRDFRLLTTRRRGLAAWREIQQK